jgi:hypothetical protein
MENLTLEETKSTPAIHFDAKSGILEITGESYPENSYEFYKPILKWITRFAAQHAGSIVLNCNLSYLNTGSTKSMMDVFDLLEDRFQQGVDVRVRWLCDSENDRAIETAEEFMEDVTFPFTIKHINEN